MHLSLYITYLLYVYVYAATSGTTTIVSSQTHAGTLKYIHANINITVYVYIHNI